MPRKLIAIDRSSPMLLPPDLRDWIAEDHIVHFIIESVEALNMESAKFNERGTGSAQYPPSLMLALLVYCYATGTFSSRKIERLSYENVAVRYLCAGHHPDHDSICTFRRNNAQLLKDCFSEVLECAAKSKILKVGDITLAVDGTKILASASKHSAVSHDFAVEQMKLLQDEVKQLMAKADEADSVPLKDGLSVPEEIQRREDRIKVLQEAVTEIKKRAAEAAKEEIAQYRAKQEEREAKEADSGKKLRGRKPHKPSEEPKAEAQVNLTDPDSRIMPTRGKTGFEQSYNAQAGVEIDSRLIVTQLVTQAPNDKEQLKPVLEALDPTVESIGRVLVDSGYYSEAVVIEVEGHKEGRLANTEVYAATRRHKHGVRVTDLEKSEDPREPEEGASVKDKMEHRLGTQAGKELYGQRKQTIEPVFGIIKAAIGFRGFSLRGMEKVSLEWTLVTLSYNLKRLFHIRDQAKVA